MNNLIRISLRLMFSPVWITMINLGLSAILGYQAVQWWLSSSESPLRSSDLPPLPSSSVTNLAPLPTATLTITDLLAAQLFGAPKKVTTVATAPTTVAVVPPPTTPLNLKLHGIYYNSDPQNSLAIVATADNKTARYKLGETLPNGVIIDKIEPKRVILLRQGRPEILYLLGSNPSEIPVNNDQADTTNSVSSNNISNDTTPGKLLGDYQRQLQSNPQNLMKLLRMSPVNQDGRFIGYRLSPGKEADQFSQFNLHVGDILTAVNGTKLDSPLKGLTVIEQLASADQIELQILREGQLVTLSFTVEK